MNCTGNFSKMNKKPNHHNNVTNINKKKAEKAEEIVQDIQLQWEQEATDRNNKLIEDRLVKCKQRLSKYFDKMLENPLCTDASFQFQMEFQKLRDLSNMETSFQPPADFDESRPRLQKIL